MKYQKLYANSNFETNLKINLLNNSFPTIAEKLPNLIDGIRSSAFTKKENGTFHKCKK